MITSYIGPIVLENNLYLKCQATDSSGTPRTATSDALTYRIYGPSGGSARLTGSFSTTVIDSQTGYYITAALGITAANGFAAGELCSARVAYAYSGTNYVREYLFVVT